MFVSEFNAKLILNNLREIIQTTSHLLKFVSDVTNGKMSTEQKKEKKLKQNFISLSKICFADVFYFLKNVKIKDFSS